MSECSDCGRPASAVLVLGFSCGRERCPLMRQCADCGYPLGDKPVFLGGVWFCATCNPALSEKSPPVSDETYEDAFARSLAFQDACDNGPEGDE